MKPVLYSFMHAMTRTGRPDKIRILNKYSYFIRAILFNVSCFHPIMNAREANIYTAIFIISIVLGTIIIYFIVSIIRQQRKNLQLYRQNIITEITTLEKERTRMAADLHDEVGPVLSAIKLKLNSLDIENDTDKEVVEKTNMQIDSLIMRMREISFDLMPNSLIRKGLIIAIGEFIEYFSKKSPLTINFHFPEGVNFKQRQSINLYRLIQEIIHNTAKHAKATVLDIELKMKKNKVILITKDNGIGFDYENSWKNSAGQGLRNLVSRTEIFGGKMFFESGKSKGTTYIFELPITND